MSEDRPYLTPDQRPEYLVRNGYVEQADLSVEARNFLATTNFHYFLGYAGRFRQLRREGKVDGDDRIDRVIRMVELDHAVSARLFAAVRTVEWRLRSVLVDRHCELYPPKGCFLDPSHFMAANADAMPVDAVLREQIARSREPYVLGKFKTYEEERGREWRGAPRHMTDADRNAVMAELPIWTVVDGWTLGLLERVITEAKPVLDTDGERWVWKGVAATFNVSNQVFQTQLGSLIVLRNLVAHHARLWMRPTTNTPRKPKLYDKVLRDCDRKAMYVVWLTLASFLHVGGGDRELIDDLNALISQDPLYELGVKQPLQHD